MRNRALIIQKVFTFPSFYRDSFFFEFAENLDLLHI